MSSTNPIDQFILDFWRSPDSTETANDVQATPDIFDEATNAAEASEVELNEINRQVNFIEIADALAQWCGCCRVCPFCTNTCLFLLHEFCLVHLRSNSGKIFLVLNFRR